MLNAKKYKHLRKVFDLVCMRPFHTSEVRFSCEDVAKMTTLSPAPDFFIKVKAPLWTSRAHEANMSQGTGFHSHGIQGSDVASTMPGCL